ncbi:hypothetical protein Leryth_020203 [Lithospermum erythrorhizon]|nr:hypothetical protein Leryth_020203 [Lithospermum erythrorhizon]
MERGIVANASLDFIEFQAFPSQNRYEACVYLGSKRESVASGPLTQLLWHSDKVKALHSNGSVSNIKLERPANLDTSKWFSKSSLQRFLHIIASSNGLNGTNAILTEISQLEEARRFHISLYGKGSNPDCRTKETDGRYSKASTPEVETDSISSDASKNELVQAMDLRLKALRDELAVAVDKAAGGTCSSEDVIDLMKLSNYLGSSELGKTLSKFVEMFHGEQIFDMPNSEQSVSANVSGDHGRGSLKEDYQIAKPPQSVTPVKYGVSPAKAAQAERQSLSESEESSYSSEEDQPVAERSRTPVRCASPRRSASPMRRIQIGRTGSRRSTPLTIKSLPYISARDRIVSHKETASDGSDDEQSRNPEKNITRLSVQDAVKLFENKQKEQTIDGQKDRSLSKSVMRRWSAGTCGSSKNPSDIASESVPTGPSTLEGEEEEKKSDSRDASNGHSDEPSNVNVEINSPGCIISSADNIEVSQSISAAGINERLTSSAEWGRQKEAELNQLLMKMMETRPTKYQTIPDTGRKKKVTSDSSNEKRDLKLPGATARKQTEKGKQSKGTQQVLGEKRAAMASKISSGTGGHDNVKKPQKATKNVSQSAKPKVEATKPSIIKRSTQRSSPLPATRKSWPSTPSSKGTIANSATTTGRMPLTGTTTTGGVPLAGATTARRKQQPTPSVPLPSTKVDGSQLRQKPMKSSQGDLEKTTKAVSEKKLQAKVKSGKSTKPIKSQSAAADPPPSAKPSLYSKVTKKSSVVPLESKPFLKKGSGIGSGVSPTVKTKASPRPEISEQKTGDILLVTENDFVPNCPSIAIEQADSDVEGMKVHVNTESEIVTGRLQVREDQEIPDKIMPKNDDTSERIVESPLMSDAEEETIISPEAWVEREEQEHQPNQCIGDSIPQIESESNSVQVKIPSPRVRHSLSQMLLEEINEPHVIEWGNAENPPSMIYQKDAPKGFKRLLKFARKSKTDASSSGWSSPSVFSEGEDDAEDSKAVIKKNAENLLKKATLRSLESYEDNPASHELSAQANRSKLSSQTLSQKLREGHASAPVTSTKASRSFFSLSAFKGGN